jgi:hypothetical protein
MTPTIQTLKRAVALAEQIENLQAELAGILGTSKAGSPPVTVSSAKAKPGRKKKGKLSAEGLANIRAAQQARWAKVKGKSDSSKPAASAGIKKGKKKKGKMSAAGRAAIVAAQKLRWAKVKAGKAAMAKKG